MDSSRREADCKHEQLWILIVSVDSLWKQNVSSKSNSVLYWCYQERGGATICHWTPMSGVFSLTAVKTQLDHPTTATLIQINDLVWQTFLWGKVTYSGQRQVQQTEHQWNKRSFSRQSNTWNIAREHKGSNYVSYLNVIYKIYSKSNFW